MSLPACPGPLFQLPKTEIDCGGTLALAALPQGMRAGFDILTAHNLDMDLQAAIEQTPQEILAAGPALLTLRSGASLATARDLVAQAPVSLSLAITSVLAETDDQLIIAPQNRAGAAKWPKGPKKGTSPT